VEKIVIVRLSGEPMTVAIQGGRDLVWEYTLGVSASTSLLKLFSWHSVMILVNSLHYLEQWLCSFYRHSAKMNFNMLANGLGVYVMTDH
jgi:hypothetical protein